MVDFMVVILFMVVVNFRNMFFNQRSQFLIALDICIQTQPPHLPPKRKQLKQFLNFARHTDDNQNYSVAGARS